jgi:single-strand DNA-binding protein
MQQHQIIGNVVADATIKIHQDKKFVSFRVAVNDNYKTETGEKVERVDWYQVTTKQESLASYLKKGTAVFIQGKLRVGTYQDQEGKTAISLDLRAEKIQLLGTPKDKENK